MELAIIIVAALVIGWKASEAWHLFTFRQILEDLKIDSDRLKKLAEDKGLDLPKQEDEESQLPILEVRVEKTDLGLFAYRKADSLFLARGADREELMQNLVNNLTNVRVIVHKEDGADLINPVA